MSGPMRIRATTQGDITTVRVLVSHDMESGQRKDTVGNTVPAKYIQNISAVVGGRVVMNAYWGTSVSKNPFIQFSFRGARSGDKLVMSWIDNDGEKRSDEVTLT